MGRFCSLKVVEPPKGSENGTENALLKIPLTKGGKKAKPSGGCDEGSEESPEVPPCPTGDAVFIGRGAATRHEKLL
jgi:hypothetical protein